MSYTQAKDISTDDCIRGSGKPSDATGYLRKSRKNKVYYQHRLAYSDVNGPIPEGYHVHHLCDNKLCVNPSHLVALTLAEHNIVHTQPKSREYSAQLAYCPQGHELDGKNKKQRYCLTCHRKASALWRTNNPGYAKEYNKTYERIR